MPTTSQRNNGELLSERREELHYRGNIRTGCPTLKPCDHRLRHTAQLLEQLLRDATLLPRANQLPDQCHAQIALSAIFSGVKSLFRTSSQLSPIAELFCMINAPFS